MSLANSIQSNLEIDPDAIAIEFAGDSYRWGEVADLVEAINVRLNEAGIGSGAQVGLLLRNRPEMISAIIAMITSERCIVCVNPMQGDAKLAKDLRTLCVPALIACAEDWSSESVRRSANALSQAQACRRCERSLRRSSLSHD